MYTKNFRTRKIFSKTNHIKPRNKIHNSRGFGFLVLFRPLATNELTENEIDLD